MNRDVIRSKKENDPFGKFEYELKGMYYTVYSYGNDDFHMCKSDKSSLKARIQFFKTYGIKETSDEHDLVDLFCYYIGLPIDVMLNKKSLKEVDDLLERISFDDDIPCEKKNIQKGDFDLDGQDDSLLKCNNYLIKNGFFFLDLDEIKTSLADKGARFFHPHLDESRIPSFLIEEKETSHKLVMDFASDPFSITKDVFIRYYEPLDRMTLSEKFDYAFAVSEQVDSNQFGAIVALRRYFSSLMLKVIDEFYEKEYRIRGMFGFSVLDQDFGYDQNQYRLVYLGLQFNMYASEYRKFELKDGKVIQKYKPEHYVFDSKDKPILRQAFNMVKKYFDRHREYAYNPCVFLKLMGLPYPAFEISKYYDFENGDSIHFANLFEFRDEVDYLGQGLNLPGLSIDGKQISMDMGGWNEIRSFHYYRRRGVFVSNPGFLLKDSGTDYLLNFKSTNPLSALLSGDIEFYEGIKDKLDDFTYQELIAGDMFSEVKELIVKQQKNGVIRSVSDYFSMLNSGYSAHEAEEKLKVLYPSMSLISFRVLIVSAFSFKALGKEETMKYIFNTRINQCIEKGEVFYDPYLKYPYVFKGNFFFVYSDGKGHFYMDSDDKKPLEMIQKIYFEKFQNTSTIPMVCSVFGKEYIQNKYISKMGGEMISSLGLPFDFVQRLNYRQDLISQIHFEDHISLFSDERHRDMLREDDSLNYLYVFEEALRRGFYLIGKGKRPSPIIALSGQAPMYDSLLSTDYFMTVEEEEECDGCFDEIQSLSKMEQKDIKKDLFGTDAYSSYIGGKSWYPYGKIFNKALYETIYDELFKKGDKLEHYIGCFKKDGMYIAPGRNFYMFSKDGENFGFLEEDAKRIIEFSKPLLKYKTSHMKKGFFFTKFVSSLGVPEIFKAKLFSLLKGKKGILYESDFPIYKEELDISLENLPCYDGMFKLTENRDGLDFISSYVRHIAIEKGFFPSADFMIGNDCLKMAVTDLSELFFYTFSIENNEDYILDDCKEEVYRWTHPTEMELINRIDEFVSEVIKKESFLNSENLLLVKEALIYMYRIDKEFIVKMVNTKCKFPWEKVKLFLGGFQLNILQNDENFAVVCCLCCCFIFDLMQKMMIDLESNYLG